MAEFDNALRKRFDVPPDKGAVVQRIAPHGAPPESSRPPSPNRKNDNNFTEQKNNDVVRRQVGYLCLQTEQEVELLNRLYDRLRLLVNFFHPSRKLVAKTRQGARVRRVYDAPQTPYQRVLACPEVSEDRLRRQFDTLNPAELQREVVRVQGELLSLVQQQSHPAERAG